MKKLAVAFAVCIISTTTLLAQIADGDLAYAMRAEGHKGGKGQATQIDAAIAAYQRAVAQNPNDLEVRWKLLRALRFKGSYVAQTKDEKKAIFDQARKMGEQSLAILDRSLAAKGVSSVSKATEQAVVDAARSIPNAGELVYWDAVSWGEWALVFGKFAAVKQGVADRIRRESTIVMKLDPKIEGGGGARVLGRLHNQTPRVPFLTGWASDSQAVKYLYASLAQDPTNKLTKVFLAEAMVAAGKDAKPEAIKILKDVVSSPNDPAHAVEQAAAQDDARMLLRQWGAR